MPLSRSGNLPLYHQIKNIILKQISEHGLKPGNKLPGDFELCSTYQVSRTVVRQALSELEFDGVLERIKGKGTFVAKPTSIERFVAIHRGDMSQFEVVVQKNFTKSGWPSMVVPELVAKL